MTDHNYDPDTLAERLDSTLPPGRFDTPAQDSDPLIDAAVLVASPPQPAPISAEARQRIRAQMLAAHRQQHSRRVIHFPLLSLVRWGVAAGLALALLVGGVQPAVLASVPGDVFYPIKQTVEQVEIALARSPLSQALVYVTHAERRAEEALILLERDQLPPDLMLAALDDLAAASAAVREDSSLSATARFQIEARSLQVNALLDAALTLAAQLEEVPQDTIRELVERIQATQTGGGLLLPAAPMVTATPEATTEPNVDDAEIASATPAAESTQEATEIPSSIVIAGPIAAVDGNVITIFDIEIEVDPDDPILAEIRVGDDVRIEGSPVEVDGAFIIVAIEITIVEVKTGATNAPAGPPPAPQGSSDCSSNKDCKQSKKS